MQVCLYSLNQNDIHQADILCLPHDKFKKKIYKYALNVVDIASRYKGSYQLTTKNTIEVAQAFQWIYENTPLNYPKTLIVDDGKGILWRHNEVNGKA